MLTVQVVGGVLGFLMACSYILMFVGWIPTTHRYGFTSGIDKSFSERFVETGNTLSTPRDKYGPRFKWPAFVEGQLLGAYFYGYTVGSLPGGPIAEFFGPYWTITVSSVVCAVVTSASVLCVMETWAPLFVCRIIVGLVGGCQYPALHGLIAAWAPPNEKGSFVACLMGNVLGAVITQAAVGYLVARLEWYWGFYFTGLMAALFIVSWVILVSDHPNKSWFCSAKEVDFILEQQQGSVQSGRSKQPFLKMATSIPFIILVICQFGNLWSLYLLLTVVPKFMADVLKFDIENVGFLTSTPSLSRFVCGFIFGGIADFLLKRELLRKVVIRKGFILFCE
ncbi:hypothetical protein HHI36_015406 [Cryptolaemus montrouzieri]|uniref:Major facilitator superfamily (MFS) profile domain-containing protein n=1 Tax=Cryptolaemus montrouzieri TaxID=559131 RepID=A0ABD2N5I6_9CUCU